MHSYLNEQTDFSNATQKSALRSAKKLENNMSGGVCLTLVTILLYFCVCLIGAIASIFINTLTMADLENSSFGFSEISGALCSLILSILLLAPLRLSIKGWYRKLSKGQTPLVFAFSSFTSFKRYIEAVCFSFVRMVAIMLISFVFMLPSAIMFGVTKGIFFGIGNLDESSIWFLFFGILFFAIGLIFIFLMAIKLFYVDYIFLSGRTKNPFKALVYSIKLSSLNKKLLYRAIGSALPYFLACLFIVPIPFAVPKIQSVFATHAGMALAQQNKNAGTV